MNHVEELRRLRPEDVRNDREVVLPHGLFHPTAIPPRTLEAAGAVFLAGGRVELSDLAARLGVSRSTLYRQCGSREQLISAMIWAGGRPMLSSALQRADGRSGAARIIAFTEAFMEALRDHPRIPALVREEPRIALRALVANDSVCHQGAVTVVHRLLIVEEARGHLSLPEDPLEIAEEITDIAERSTYVDIIAGNEPGIPRACRAIGHLLNAMSTTP